MVAVKILDVFQLEKNIDGDPGSRGAKDPVMYVILLVNVVVIVCITSFYMYLLT